MNGKKLNGHTFDMQNGELNTEHCEHNEHERENEVGICAIAT